MIVVYFCCPRQSHLIKFTWMVMMFLTLNATYQDLNLDKHKFWKH